MFSRQTVTVPTPALRSLIPTPMCDTQIAPQYLFCTAPSSTEKHSLAQLYGETLSFIPQQSASWFARVFAALQQNALILANEHEHKIT